MVDALDVLDDLDALDDLEMKSEFLISLFSRSESEIEKPRDRDREVKYEKNSPEFSRNETLAGCWSSVGKTTLFQSSSQNSYIISPKVFICHSGFGTCATGTSPSPYFVT